MDFRRRARFRRRSASRQVILPSRDYPIFLRETIVVNQTVLLRDRGRFAVNPGIPPTVIAAAIGRPLRAFDVRPRVLAGTAQIPGAIEVRAQDIRSGSVRGQVTVRQTQNGIQPTGSVPQLKPLGAGEQGRLGDNPPRAARRDAPAPTTGQAPATREQQQQPTQPQQTQRPQQQEGQHLRRSSNASKRARASRSRRRPRAAPRSLSSNARSRPHLFFFGAGPELRLLLLLDHGPPATANRKG